jgi:transposase
MRRLLMSGCVLLALGGTARAQVSVDEARAKLEAKKPTTRPTVDARVAAELRAENARLKEENSNLAFKVRELQTKLADQGPTLHPHRALPHEKMPAWLVKGQNDRDQWLYGVVWAKNESEAISKFSKPTGATKNWLAYPATDDDVMTFAIPDDDPRWDPQWRPHR